jgi:hypothetical protein|nr:MAG TPA: hypothetical protein [Caudoviricetes sp.]
MTVLGDKLREALNDKANDVNSYVWKGPKVNGVQEEIKLVDADYDQLKRFYNHCEQMLYNSDTKNPGRLTLLDIVSDQIQRCRAELLIRWLRAEKQYTNTRCLEDLRITIKNNKEILTNETIKVYPIGNILNGIPVEFREVPVSLVMDACLDSLGLFDNSHLTLNFIVKMGLWFTQQEMQKDLYRKDPVTGKAVNRLLVVSKELRLNPSISLKICDTGLSYAEFRSMCRLKRDKYANLTSDQLRLLSSKVLYRFQNQCESQAKQWKDKMEEIKKVAELKGWDITRNID